MNRCSTEDFQGSETILYDTIIVHTSHYTFVKTHRMYNLRVNLNVNHGFGVIMMCQCKFIDYNKCTILMQDVDGRGSVRVCVCVQKVHGNSLYIPFDFAVNVKLL